MFFFDVFSFDSLYVPIVLYIYLEILTNLTVEKIQIINATKAREEINRTRHLERLFGFII